MSRDARREYLEEMQRRYHSCRSREEKSRPIDVAAETLNCHPGVNSPSGSYTLGTLDLNRFWKCVEHLKQSVECPADAFGFLVGPFSVGGCLQHFAHEEDLAIILPHF